MSVPISVVLSAGLQAIFSPCLCSSFPPPEGAGSAQRGRVQEAGRGPSAEQAAATGQELRPAQAGRTGLLLGQRSGQGLAAAPQTAPG